MTTRRDRGDGDVRRHGQREGPRRAHEVQRDHDGGSDRWAGAMTMAVLITGYGAMSVAMAIIGTGAMVPGEAVGQQGWTDCRGRLRAGITVDFGDDVARVHERSMDRRARARRHCPRARR